MSAYNKGDRSALDELATRLYTELKQIARNRARRSRDLGATTLVQETFIKLLSGRKLELENRQHFFALSATIMRQIVIDDIRQQRAAKRDGLNVTFADTVMPDGSLPSPDFLLQVDDALRLVSEEDERLTRAFECRYFAGMSIDETAECLGVSARTAERLWSRARTRIVWPAWLALSW